MQSDAAPTIDNQEANKRIKTEKCDYFGSGIRSAMMTNLLLCRLNHCFSDGRQYVYQCARI